MPGQRLAAAFVPRRYRRTRARVRHAAIVPAVTPPRRPCPCGRASVPGRNTRVRHGHDLVQCDVPVKHRGTDYFQIESDPYITQYASVNWDVRTVRADARTTPPQHADLARARLPQRRWRDAGVARFTAAMPTSCHGGKQCACMRSRAPTVRGLPARQLTPAHTSAHARAPVCSACTDSCLP